MKAAWGHNFVNVLCYAIIINNSVGSSRADKPESNKPKNNHAGRRQVKAQNISQKKDKPPTPHRYVREHKKVFVDIIRDRELNQLLNIVQV